MNRLLKACVGVGVLAGFSGTADAQEVKYTFQAKLVILQDESPPAPYEDVQLGAPLTLSLCVETSAADQAPRDPATGLYSGAITNVSLDVDGIQTSFVPDELNTILIGPGSGLDPADSLFMQMKSSLDDTLIHVQGLSLDGSAFADDSLFACQDLDIDAFDFPAVAFGFASWGLFEIESVECSTCVEPECFLVIGNPRAPGAAFAPYSHAFDTQVGQVDEWYPVLLDDIPEFVIWEAPPSMRAALAGIDPTVSVHANQLGAEGAAGVVDNLDVVTYADPLPQMFTAQVLMWNPQVFPSNPEQFTHGLAVTIRPNGSVVSVPYGSSDGGLSIWAETEWNDQGQKILRLPFSIPGF